MQPGYKITSYIVTQSADLKNKAKQLDRLGEREAANRARAQAAALDRKIKAYIDAENNM